MDTIKFSLPVQIDSSAFDAIINRAALEILGVIRAGIDPESLHDLVRDRAVAALGSVGLGDTPAPSLVSPVVLPENTAAPGGGVQQQIDFAQPIPDWLRVKLSALIAIFNEATWRGCSNGIKARINPDDPWLAVVPDTNPERIYLNHRHPVIRASKVLHPWVLVTTALVDFDLIFLRSPASKTLRFVVGGVNHYGLAFNRAKLIEMGLDAIKPFA